MLSYKDEEAAKLKGSLFEFKKFFFKYITGRDYVVSNPVGRQSHHIILSRAFTKVFRELSPNHGLEINMPPGYGKSLECSMFVAWAYAHYPDCNFLYVSYSHTLAAKHTAFIKLIMTSEMYRHLFDVHIRSDSRAKDHFVTSAGGTTAAFGSAGAITGRDAGLPGLDRFSGAVIIDDPLKPDEAHSDTIREKVKRNYQETILQRPRDKTVPIISISQRLHEDDLSAYFESGNDVREWERIVLQGLDAAGNALYPEVQTKEYLLDLQDKQPYVFASQIQQDPIPAGGALFRVEHFVELEQEPEILATFIVADTAETDKTYNDASVFSFFGIYEIENFGRKTGDFGLHWLDCLEARVEPKDLQDLFISFYAECNRHSCPPKIAYIEKKSTGTTLVSTMSSLRGMQVRDIPRSRASGSKTTRFLELQPYVASGLISFTAGARHQKMCIDHMSKITPNGAHRHDDICFVADTLIATPYGNVKIQDIKIGDKVITPFGVAEVEMAGLTKENAQVVTRRGLIGTPNHPIFINDRFMRLDTLADGVKVSSLSLSELLQWRIQKLLFSMESNINSCHRDVITLVSQRITSSERAQKACMWQFGSFIAARKFQKAMLFIIRITTLLIITTKTWSVYRTLNTLKYIKKIGCAGIIARKAGSILRKLCKGKQENGINQKKAEHGILRMPKNVRQKYFTNVKRYVFNAKKNLLIKTQMAQFYAASYVAVDTELNALKCSRPIALSAQKNLQQKRPYHALETAKVAQENALENCPVYNLKIKEHGVYYANGILVSNCDTLADGVRLALVEKTIYNIDKDDTATNTVTNLRDSFKRKQGALRNARGSQKTF